MAYTFNDATPDFFYENAIHLGAYPATVSAWAYPHDVGGDRTIWAEGDTASSTRYVAMLFDSGGELKAWLRDGGTRYEPITVNTATTNAWNHCCAVYKNATDQRVYLNGDTANRGQNTTNINWSGNVDDTAIGVLRISINYGGFDGELAHVAAWNAELDEDEVVALSMGFSPLLVRPGSLVYYFPMLRDINDVMGTSTMTADPGGGFPAVNGDVAPAIFYPTTPQIGLAAAGAPPAGANPKGVFGLPVDGPLRRVVY